MPLNLEDQRAEPYQIVGTEPGATGRCLGERILPGHTRPSGQNRAQASLRIEVHHPIFTPVLPPRGEYIARATLRVKGMSDLKMHYLSGGTSRSC